MSLPKNITLCMGSSCFSRGNAENMNVINKFLEEHGLSTKLTFRGCRCGGRCSEGPNMWIDGEPFTGVTQEKLQQFLNSLLEE